MSILIRICIRKKSVITENNILFFWYNKTISIKTILKSVNSYKRQLSFIGIYLF